MNPTLGFPVPNLAGIKWPICTNVGIPGRLALVSVAYTFTPFAFSRSKVGARCSELARGKSLVSNSVVGNVILVVVLRESQVLRNISHFRRCFLWRQATVAEPPCFNVWLQFALLICKGWGVDASGPIASVSGARLNGIPTPEAEARGL